MPLLRRAIYQHYEYWIERLGTRGVIDAIGVSPEASPFEFDQFAPSDAFSEAESDRDLRNSLGRLLTSEHRASVSETSPPAGGSL